MGPHGRVILDLFCPVNVRNDVFVSCAYDLFPVPIYGDIVTKLLPYVG
jgi:hypothetical protein